MASSTPPLSRRSFLQQSAVLGGGTVLAVGAASAATAAPPSPGPVLDVRDFGAVGDGRQDATAALQNAIETAARGGGGVVHVPAGTWRAGTVHLRSHVTLDLAPGATLLASSDDDDFAPHERLAFDSDSDRDTTSFARALLSGRDLERVAVVGYGVIDMNRTRRGGPKPIALQGCREVTVRDVRIVHAPNYAISLGRCDDVLIDGVVIRDAYADGIDPDCCRRVRISNCDIEADDDALCLKASFQGACLPTEDVVVGNCRLRSPSNCFKIGTESSGDFRRIVVSNCVFDGRPAVGHGLRMAEGGGVALTMVDGGTIDGVVVSNVVMEGVVAPVFVRLGNRGRDQSPARPGRLRNVSISGVVATGGWGTAAICGLPGHPVEGVTLENVRIVGEGGWRRPLGLDLPERPDAYPQPTMFGRLPAAGLYVRHARDLTLRNLQLATDEADVRTVLLADDVDGLHLSGLSSPGAARTGPVVWLNGVQGAFVQGNRAPAGNVVFVRVTGERTRDLVLMGNAYASHAPVEIAPDIPPHAVVQVANLAGTNRSA